MADCWTIRADVPREVARATLIAHEDAADWPEDWVLIGMEIADDRPEDWFIEAYIPHRPTAGDRRKVAALFADGARRLRAAFDPRVPKDLVYEAAQRLAEPGALSATLNWQHLLAYD